jgi:Cu2+-containing amine oxidase
MSKGGKMNRTNFFVALAVLSGLLILPRSASGQTRPPWMPCSGVNLVDQKFPVIGPEETHWRLCMEAAPRNGLMIHWAFFRKSPSAPWLRLFWDARVSDIFVPYHSGAPRFYDMSNFMFPMTPIGVRDCPAAVGGTPLGGNVCKEVRDRGLAWKDDANVRRGQELVLWGALDAANYNYVIEWTFRDDGVVLARVGATAVNLPGIPYEAHMHNPIWRLDIDLNGFPADSVSFGTHTEIGATATDTDPVIAQEGSRDWNPHAFNSLDVSDATLVNGHRHKTYYQLIPLPTGGLSRHQESFTQHDFWVTTYNGTQLWAAQLPSYVNPPQNAANTDIVVWYKGSIHHHPRDEDGEYVGHYWRGEALVMWTGFMLKPHDLFDRTPLYP